MDIITLIMLLIVIAYFIYYFVKYRIALKKNKSYNFISGEIKKIELDSKSSINTEIYNLSVITEDGEKVKTSIERDFGLFRKYYIWIPKINDTINVYKDEDGSYGNDYKLELKKRNIPYLIMAFILVLIGLVICSLSLIFEKYSFIDINGTEIFKYEKSTTPYNYNFDYSVIINRKNEYVIKTRNTTKKINKSKFDNLVSQLQFKECKLVGDTYKFVEGDPIGEVAHSYIKYGVYYDENNIEYCFESTRYLDEQISNLLK